MKKFALNINVFCNDQSILDEIIDTTPAIDDPRVDPDDYRPALHYLDDDTGRQAITAMVMFTLEADRDAVDDEIRNIAGVLFDCEAGTAFKQVDTTHRKEGNHIVAGSPCEATLIVRVVG